jgi:Zn-dependent peptidase ImmA (M78 family)
MLDTEKDSSADVSMKALYKRLRTIGLTRPIVRNTLLPDWWCDEFEEREGAVFEAAAYVARHTGLPFDRLIDETQELSLIQGSGLCFKKRQGTDENALAIASCVAEQVAKLVTYACRPDYQSVAGFSAQAIRAEILSKYQWVTLEGLLDFCWDHGLPVVHLNNLPKGKAINKFDGIAGVFEGRPAIATGKNHHSWAWMAFIVAHELGHIVSSHVEEGHPLVDERIAPSEDDDQQEKDADRFAVELIYGKDDVNYMRPGFVTSGDLLGYAIKQAEIDIVNPASIVLNHGWYKKNAASTKKSKKIVWAVSQKAITELEEGTVSAIKLINSYLQQGLDWDLLSDDNCEYVERIVGLNAGLH